MRRARGRSRLVIALLLSALTALEPTLAFGSGAPPVAAPNKETPSKTRRSLFGRLLGRDRDKPPRDERPKPGGEPERADDTGDLDDQRDEIALDGAASQLGPHTLAIAPRATYSLLLRLRDEPGPGPRAAGCACHLALAPLDIETPTTTLEGETDLRFAVDVRAAADRRLLEWLTQGGVAARVHGAPPALTFLAAESNALRAEDLAAFFAANPRLDLLVHGAIRQWSLTSLSVRLQALRRDLSPAWTKLYTRHADARFDPRRPEAVDARALDGLLDDVLARAVVDLGAALANDAPPSPRANRPASRAASAPVLPPGTPATGSVLVKYYLKSRIEAKRLGLIEEFAFDDGTKAPEEATLMVPEVLVRGAPVGAQAAEFPDFELNSFLLSAQRQQVKRDIDLRRFVAKKDRQRRVNKYQISIATRTLTGVPVGIHLVELVHDSRVRFYDNWGELLTPADAPTFLQQHGENPRTSLLGLPRTGSPLTQRAQRTRFALVKVPPGEKTVLVTQLERTTAATRLTYKFSDTVSTDFGRHYLQNAKDLMRALLNAHMRGDRAEFAALMADNYLIAVKQAPSLLLALQLVADRVDQNLRYYLEDKLTQIVQLESCNTVIDDGLFLGYSSERRIDSSVAAMSESEARDLFKVFFLYAEMEFARKPHARELMTHLYGQFVGNRLMAAEIERRAKGIKSLLKLDFMGRSHEAVMRDNLFRQVRRYVQYAVTRAQVYDDAYDFVAAVAREARARIGDAYLDQVLLSYRRHGFPSTLKFVPPKKRAPGEGGEPAAIEIGQPLGGVSRLAARIGGKLGRLVSKGDEARAQAEQGREQAQEAREPDEAQERASQPPPLARASRGRGARGLGAALVAERAAKGKPPEDVNARGRGGARGACAHRRADTRADRAQLHPDPRTGGRAGAPSAELGRLRGREGAPGSRVQRDHRGRRQARRDRPRSLPAPAPVRWPAG